MAEKQERANRVPSSNRQVDSLISFEEYLRYDDIVQYLFNVSDLQDWANVVEIGTSYEGRTMYALEITKAGDDAVANIYSQVILLINQYYTNPYTDQNILYLGRSSCKRMDC